MLDHAIGPNVIKRAASRGCEQFLERHADEGWHSLDDFRGLRRDRIVAHGEINGRPDKPGQYLRRARRAFEGYADQAVKTTS